MVLGTVQPESVFERTLAAKVQVHAAAGPSGAPRPVESGP